MGLERQTIRGADLPPMGYFSGTPFYQEWCRPVSNRPGPFGWVKPLTGGLWTSRIYSDGCPREDYCPGRCRTPWEHWCEENDFRSTFFFQYFIGVELVPEARVLVINSMGDLKAALEVYLDARRWEETEYFNDRYLDYELLAKDFDAIWLTEEGQWRTHLGHAIGDPDLYSWDCETVFVLNPNSIARTWYIERNEMITDPTEIPLRAKYRTAQKGRYKGGERFAPKKKRVKIGYLAHEKRFGTPVPRVKVVQGGTGKSVMRNAS